MMSGITNGKSNGIYKISKPSIGRNDDVDVQHISNEKPDPCCGAGFLRLWAWLQRIFSLLLEKIFEKSAMFISRRPFLVIFFCLFLVITLTCGFSKLKVESNVKYLFLPEDSQASQDLQKARRLRFEFEFRQEEVIFLAKHNASLLSKECLSEIVDLHKIITEIKYYNQQCFRANPSSTCVSTNLLEIFDYQKKNLVDISRQIQTALLNDTFLMSNGRRFQDNFNQIFGKGSPNGSLDSSTALRIVYFMKEYSRGDEKRDGILEWENIFLDEVSSFAKNTTCVNIFYSAERSLDDSVKESTTSDIKFFAMSFVIMGIFSGVINSRCGDDRFGHQLLGFTSLLAIYFGITAALGFLMFIGVPFVSLVGVLPFLVVSIGIDDVFIILHELNDMVRQNIPAMYMLSGTMARSGPTITMTTLTDLVAFAVSCRSIFPAIRFFCTYAAVTICSAFLMLVTFFVGCMWFDIKRVNAQRRDLLPCLMSPQQTSCCLNIRKNGFDNAMKAWGKLITSLPGKVVVCLCSLLLLSGGIYGALNIDESFNRQLLTSEDSYYRQFLKIYEENFFLNIEVSIIFPGQFDHSSKDIQEMYSDVVKVSESSEYFISRRSSWLSEYKSWAKEENIDINDTSIFYKHLRHFISLPKFKRFSQDLMFSKNKQHLLASRVLIYSKDSSDSIFQRDMMISIREDLSRLTDHNAFAVAPSFIYFEQYAHVLSETIRNIIVAGISILLISSLFLNHFAIIICLLCGFIALIIELLGLMYIWDVSINSISMINLVMALGFSVDYNAHVAYHFVSSNAASSELRVIDALGKIGGSVFLGGFSTFLGMMPTGFASSTIFQIFFKMFVGIVVLGLFHGLVILPVYLTLLGKIFDFRKMNIDPLIFETLQRAKKQKSRKMTESGMNSFKYLGNAKKSNPAAIVGMACRYSGGVNSKDDFWNLLVEGRCGIGTYPTNRPDSREFIDCFSSGKNTPGKHHVLTGCFLDNITGFDSQFFRISPTEARSMDPQQRILLQVVYEAIEDAGMRLEDLQQCQTGVYVGLMNAEFGTLLLQTSNIRSIDQFCSTGAASSIAANRISYSLNLTGPSLTLDTACSSSLVAFDVAFGHLQTGECDVAIVCAPNILLTGYQYHIACCRTGLLAEDGRCKSFDIKGDGYGRGEGVAAVVIKPTKTAKEDHDDIYAEVVACGVNNDGQTAIPMTAPSEVTQAALFQRVLQESGLSKDDIQYVEVHGTGTAIGDVVEMGSVASVYGNSSNRKLRLGSVKSNVNHTESTAGLSGLMKTCLMIKHGQFVPTVNVQEVKPQLKMSERKMMVQLRNEPWNTDGGAPRTAAVSSYGFGGTNAHVIVREVIKIPETGISIRSTPNRVMTLSAASNDALREMAQKVSLSFQTKSDDDEILKDNICYSLNERYTVHSHRLALSFSSLKHATRALQMFADKEKGWEESVAYGEVNNTHDKIVFLYGGQGAQWYGMAREMLIHEPKFKESIEKIDSLLKRYGVSWSLISELKKSEETSRLDENPIGQTALFAIHFALTELLESWGVTPSAVVGHSLGEISAAWASGALRLHKALQLVLFRSQLHEKCSPTGCMVAIGLSEENARNLLQDLALESEVDVAVMNSPGNVVLSGSRESIELVEKHVINSRSDLFLKKLSTTRAYHSREMEEIKQSFFKLTSKFNVRQTHTNIPFYSTVTGDQLSGQLLTLEHWWRNIRQAVLLETALKTIFSDGYHFFTEINATPQLSYHIRRTWSHNKTAKSLNGNDAVVIQTLPKRSARQQHLSFLQNCAANLFTNGVQLTWSRLQGSGSQSFSPRPTYPWQEREFWYRKEHPPEFVTFLDGEKPEENKDIMAFHPLLGKAVPTEMFTGLQAWESEINLYSVSYIGDHKFSDSPEPVLPASLYVEMVLALSLHLSPSATPDVHNISFDHLLTISESDSHKIRTRLLPEKWPANGNQFQITIVNESEIEVVLSEGCIQLGVNDSYGNKEMHQHGNSEDVDVFKSTMIRMSRDYIIEERQRKGCKFGPRFDLIQEAWSRGNESLALICPTAEMVSEASVYVIHPSVIDACFQTMLLVKGFEGKFVPKTIARVTMVQKPTSTERFYAHTKLLESEKTPSSNITLMDCYARPIMIIEKYATAEIASDMSKVSYENSSFTLNWEMVMSEASEDGSQKHLWLIISDQSTFSERLVQHIPAGDRVILFAKTSQEFAEVLEEVESNMRADEKLLVINLWPVDCSKYDVNTSNVDATQELAFESCLVISQEILKRENLSKDAKLVFVTAGVVTVPQQDPVTINSDTFPWSASLFGFRRTFAEEIKTTRASVVDLPLNPCEDDFQALVEGVRKPAMEEEVVYRNGVRYVNRIKELSPARICYTKPTSSLTEDGIQEPFRMISMSEQWFLQKTYEINERNKIEVHYACPVLQKGWEDLETNDRIAFAGKFLEGQDENQVPLVVGICNVDDLGSYVETDKCCFTEINACFTAQQAASLCFPLAISYHILNNLLGHGDIEGKKVLIYNQSEEVCCIFACVAMSWDIKVVCVVKNQSRKERMEKFENVEVISESEIKAAEMNPKRCMDSDAVCLFSRSNTYVTNQIMKHLKPGAKVIIANQDKNVKFNPLIHGKNLHCIVTNLESILEHSKDFSKLLASCCSVLQSRKLLGRLLEIPQLVSNIYDVMNKYKSTTHNWEKSEGNSLYTVAFKPKNIPEQVDFYNLPLDTNGLKGDRTYLVIGGVRGFGFEFAKWMVENGAKTVMCTSRSAPSAEKKALVQQLEDENDSRILLRQADATSSKDMNLIKKELEFLPAVAGIAFTAMVLEDQLLPEADLITCKRVMETKVKGSVMLHQLSLSMDLDFFIMFSSISGVLGNVGQVSYAAANSFMDQLCEYRRHKLGLPALSVNWGPISGTGVLERKSNIVTNLEKHGYHTLHYSTAIDFLKRVLLENSNQTQVCLAALNWQVYLQSHTSPRLQVFRNKMQIMDEKEKNMTLEDLALQPLEFRMDYVQDYIKRLLSSWSGSDIAEIDINVGLVRYGIDSIAATDMKLRIQSNIGAVFETYYFIQPKTSGLTIINDILEKIENICKGRSENVSKEKNRQSMPVSTIQGTKNDILPANDEGNLNTSDNLELSELQTVETESHREKVIPLYNPEDAVVNVFLIHSSQKSALALAPFALGFQQQTHVALYGIGVDDTSFQRSDYGTVTCLAQRYVRLIKEIQSHGPYYLAGYSFGGTVAYEMASNLKRNDENVAMVFMVDTYAWYPKALINCSEHIKKCAAENMKSAKKFVRRQVIEKVAFVALGITQNELDNLYEELEEEEKVIAALQNQAAEKNMDIPLKENAETVQYEIESATNAHNEWQPSKICYNETITYICCDETSSFRIWNPEIWNTLVERMDFFYVSGGHFELCDETRGKICGSIMMTTASIKYRSTFSTFKLQVVRSRPQERLVQSLKQGMGIWMLPNPGSLKLVKGILFLDQEETVFRFEYESLGRRKTRKTFLKELTNILPGRHINAIRKNNVNKSRINSLICMITNKGKLMTFHPSDWQQLQQLTDALRALFGIPFMQ